MHGVGDLLGSYVLVQIEVFEQFLLVQPCFVQFREIAVAIVDQINSVAGINLWI